MVGYASRVRRDVDRWTEIGLIDRPTADALRRDIEAADRRSISFGTILMLMAALLFAAALLLLVAANWEAFPRILRVVVLFTVIFGGYVGGALLKSAGHGAIAEGLWLIAAAAFGGSIALIGQMYHLSGDETTAILTWCFGTAIAALALRSGPLTMGGAAIAIFWLLSEGLDYWDDSRFPYAYVGIAAGLWLVSIWTRSTAARHLLLLSLIGYAAMLELEFDVKGIATLLCVVSAGLFVAAMAAPALTERIAQLGGRLPLHALVGFLTGAAMIQFEIVDERAPLVLSALVVFAAIAAAIVMAGRESRGIRWIAYLGFCFELCFVYVATVGTMLGTAGLFLASGLALAVVAFIIIRIEKRLNAMPVPEAGAA